MLVFGHASLSDITPQAPPPPRASVQTCFRPGSDLVQTWFRPGSDLVQTWFRMHLGLCLTLLFLSGSQSVQGSDEETSENYDSVTPTPDYDYNATFDYYYVTGGFPEQDPRGQAAALNQLTSVLLLGLAASHVI